jgi:hypothetical protein
VVNTMTNKIIPYMYSIKDHCGGRLMAMASGSSVFAGANAEREHCSDRSKLFILNRAVEIG